MIQKIFATQQMAAELLKEAIAIWRQGNHSDNWEGIEKDPVVSLLMTALAYQDYSSNRDMEWLKTEVLQDFVQSLIPYDLCHVVPASVLIQTETEGNVAELSLNENCTFTLGSGQYNFIPLLNTKVYNASVKSIVRMDARRWKVSLTFKEPVKNLAGLSFAINSTTFKDLNVTIGGKTLSLIKPWDYAELPLANCFSTDAMLYNQSLIYDGSSTWFDMFAQHDKQIFVVDKYQTSQPFNLPTDKIDMIFEFTGVKEGFVFDKSQLLLNCVLLVNANLRNATLSSTQPIVRIVGAGMEKEAGEQLLHLIRPSVEQIYQGEQILVRRSAVERFNSHNLFKLLHCLLDKYSSDYYAFQQMNQFKNKADAEILYRLLKSMTNEVGNIPQSFLSGVYLMLKKASTPSAQERSIGIKYLTSNGSAVNGVLSMDSTFSTPPGLLTTATRVVSEPIPGQDEVKESHVQSSLSRYYMITNNRLVTPADIKIFCCNELLKRYNIASEMISRIVVRNHVQAEAGHPGYETSVNIVVKNDMFVKRSFADKVSQAETVLQKMIEVRSATVYPVQVTISLSS